MTMPGKTKGNIDIWSSNLRPLIDARTINHAAKKVMATAAVADDTLTIMLFITERITPLSLKAVT